MSLQATTPGELAQARDAGRVVWGVLRKVAARVRVGVTGRELADETERRVAEAGATAVLRGYGFEGMAAFPAGLSVCVGDSAVYGVPDEVPLEKGVVTLDLAVRTAAGWHADAAVPLVVGDCERARRLVEAAGAATGAVIEAMGPGVWWSEVVQVVRGVLRERGCALLETPMGHGVGRALHERPSLLVGGEDVRLRAGMVLAVESLVGEALTPLVLGENGWTLRTADGSWAAFEERMVAVTGAGVEVLTR